MVGLPMKSKIAVIDTETNYDDEVISIGCAIVDASNYKVLDKRYLIVYPACTKPAMYSYELEYKGVLVDLKSSRKDVINYLLNFLNTHEIEDIFAYNAPFDYQHLTEFNHYNWYDIMKVAAYQQYNPTITYIDNLCSTGRLRTGYGVEAILNRLRKTNGLDVKNEMHNALDDAIDEALIMELLQHDIKIYEIGLYPCAKVRDETAKTLETTHEIDFGEKDSVKDLKADLYKRKFDLSLSYEMFPILHKSYKIKYFIDSNHKHILAAASIVFRKTTIIKNVSLYGAIIKEKNQELYVYAEIIRNGWEKPVISIYKNFYLDTLILNNNKIVSLDINYRDSK
jgi:inhibitor of KinA sporulation pathway (predicted exonuclease)